MRISLGIAAAAATMMVLCCGGCDMTSVTEESGDSPKTSSDAAVVGSLDEPLKEVLAALRQQYERDSAIFCSSEEGVHAIDTGETYISLFQLEQWQKGGHTELPSAGDEQLVFSFSKTLGLKISAKTNSAQVEQGEWEKTKRTYILPEGIAAALLQYTAEHDCLSMTGVLSHCEAMEKIPVTDQQGHTGTVDMTEEIRSIVTQTRWTRLGSSGAGEGGRFLRLTFSERYSVVFSVDTGKIAVAFSPNQVHYQWSTDSAETLYRYMQGQIK